MVTNMEKDKYGIATNQSKITDVEHQNGTYSKKPPPELSPASGPTSDTPPRRPFIHRHAFVITLLLNTMIDGIGYAVNSQFRYRFFHDQYKDQLDQFNVTRGGECSAGETNPEIKEIEDNISRDTAQWGLYGDYASMLPLFIASLLIGMKSDQIGRRFLFIVPFVSSILYYGLKAAVVRLGLHYGWTLIGSFVSACTGGNIGMYFAAYALVSDTHGKKSPSTNNSTTQDNPSVQTKDTEKTAEKSEKTVEDDETDLDMSREKARTFKIVGLDVLRRLASSIMAFATGYIIQYAGFFYSLVIVICGKVLLLIFAICFVTETGEQKKSVGFMGPLRTIGRAFKDTRKRSTLILCNLALFFTIFGFVDEFEVLHTYQMSPPFCFGAVQLGWLSSESRLKGLFSMPLMWFWKRLQLTESTIAGIGSLFLTAAALVLAIFRYTWVFFANPVISIPGTLTTAMAKAITSRLIGRSALASTFAVMLAGEEVFWFAGSIGSNYMYQYFVSTVPTAPFYMASASFAVATVLYAAQSFNQRRVARSQSTDEERNVTS